MALKLNVEKLDEVEESFRPLYVEKDGKFSLAVEGIEDTSGLKSALAAERKRASDLEKKVKGWEKSGKTPEEIQELLDAHETRQQSESERKGEWDKLRAQMNDKHAKDLQAKDETIGAMRRRLEAELVDAKATAAIADAGGKPKVLLNVVKQFTKVDENFNVQIVDAKGDPRVNGKGEPLTIADLVAEIKADEDYGANFKGSNQSGSGKQPDNAGGGNPSNIKRRSDLKTRAERVAWVQANGQAAYFSLPA